MYFFSPRSGAGNIPIENVKDLFPAKKESNDLYLMGVEARIAFLDKAFGILRRRLAGSTSFHPSPRAFERDLDYFFDEWAQADNLRRMAEEAFRDTMVLSSGGGTVRNSRAGGTRQGQLDFKVHALPRGVLFNINPGNVEIAGLAWEAYRVLAGMPVIHKIPSGAGDAEGRSFILEALSESYSQMDSRNPVSMSFCSAYFPGSSPLFDNILQEKSPRGFPLVGVVSVMGDDDTLVTIRRRISTHHTLFLGFGHEYQFAFLSQGVLRDPKLVEEKSFSLAYAMSLSNQKGCYNTQFVLAELLEEEDARQVQRFIRLTVSALHRMAKLYPPEPLSGRGYQDLKAFLAKAERENRVHMAGRLSPGASFEGAVLDYTDQRAPLRMFFPGRRTVPVYRIRSREELPDYVFPSTQGVLMLALPEEIEELQLPLKRAGARRVNETPDIVPYLPWDDLNVLQSLVRLSTTEYGCPYLAGQ